MVRGGLAVVWTALWRHKALSFACVTSVVLASVASLTLLPRWYVVEAIVLVQPRGTMDALLSPGVIRDDAATQTVRDVILNRNGLQSLCRRPELTDRFLQPGSRLQALVAWLPLALGGQPPDREAALDEVIDAIQARLWVSLGADGAIYVTAEWWDPELTLAIVADALQRFLDDRRVAEIQLVQQAIEVLSRHDALLQTEIKDALATLAQHEQSLLATASPLASRIARNLDLPDEEPVPLGELLAARQRALGELEATRRLRLSTLQTQLVQQLEIYAPHHPIVAATRRQLEEVSGSSREVDDLRRQIVVLDRGGRGGGMGVMVSPVERDLAEPLWNRVAAARETNPRLAFERSLAERLIRRHGHLTEQIRAAQVELDAARASFDKRYSVIRPPLPPAGPERPRLLRVVLAAGLGGLALALFAASAAELQRGRHLPRGPDQREASGRTAVGP